LGGEREGRDVGLLHPGSWNSEIYTRGSIFQLLVVTHGVNVFSVQISVGVDSLKIRD